MEKIEANNEAEKEQMQENFQNELDLKEQKSKQLEENILNLERLVERYKIEKLTMKRDFQSVVEAVEDVERSMKEKMKQLQHELELKEEEKQQLERKNAELDKTIREETSPIQTDTEKHQNQQRQ
ncbi:hypothetical protein WMY93_007965 [Mugilogobius chulae]|uniref:Uncharacterized protein n=1 Tax=Mugilogobius chulae TaxID=88201 RepID=A0AAW0PQF8_9GOBI